MGTRKFPLLDRLLLAATAIVGSYTVANKIVHTGQSPLKILLGAMVGVLFVVCGVIARERYPDNRVGTLMIAFALAWYAEDFVLSDTRWIYSIDMFTSAASGPVLAHLVLAFPTGRLRSQAERVIVGCGYALGFGLFTLMNLISPPDPASGCACPGMALAVADIESIRVPMETMIDIGGAGVAAAVLLVLVRRFRDASPASRHALLPFNAAAAAVALTVVIDQVTRALTEDQEALIRVTSYLTLIAFSGLALGFLGGLLRLQFARAAVADIAVGGGVGLNREQTEHSLRQLLHDPELQIITNGDRAIADGRSRMSLIHAGNRLGTLVHDPSLAVDAGLLDAVAGAATLALLPPGASPPMPTPLPQLTTREAEVALLVAQGLSNAAIAETLFVSQGTVEKHLTASFEKLDIEAGANRRVALVLAVLNSREL